MVTGIHALSVLGMVPRWRSRFFQLLARLTKNNIGQDFPRSRFGKVWQNRARFYLALTCDSCDFGQPYSILPRHFSLSFQTNILINRWVLHKSLINIARTRKILHDAISGQNERLAWSCKHMLLVMAWRRWPTASDWFLSVIRQRVNFINRKRKSQRPFLKTTPKSLVTVTVTGQKWKIHCILGHFYYCLNVDANNSSRKKIFLNWPEKAICKVYVSFY